ncbi:hypothetical protein NE237_014500 [Protea cynaroides]|uniref:Uncharacterized protein n=1 Tax=Protea cynaroides TaxID=273540 RepID=A0A9Q0QQB8_9MAGN|nr:hypothetical protein NE237_014500 [Protea cynaroides]
MREGDGEFTATAGGKTREERASFGEFSGGDGGVLPFTPIFSSWIYRTTILQPFPFLQMFSSNSEGVGSRPESIEEIGGGKDGVTLLWDLAEESVKVRDLKSKSIVRDMKPGQTNFIEQGHEVYQNLVRLLSQS